MGRDHENSDARGQASRFVIAKLHETQGKTETELTSKDIQFLSRRYQENLVIFRGEKLEEKLIKKEDSIQFLFDIVTALQSFCQLVFSKQN